MSSIYRFGEFELDVERRTLRRGEREIDLGVRAFGVIELLVKNPGRVVTRAELIDGVWRDVVVTDDSLARAISDLRTALGDDPAQPRYIRTVHRHGYLFIGEVNPLDGETAPTVVEARRWWNRPRHLLLLAALLILVVASVFVVRKALEPTGASSAPDFSSWKLRALGPSAFIASAMKPALARTRDLMAVVAPDPETEVFSIFLLRPDGGEPLQLTYGMEVRGPSPEFTADDSHILFTSYRIDPDLGSVPDIWQVPVPAGEPTLLMEQASSASQSPDGRGLAYAAVTPHGTSIRVRHQDGRDVEVAERGFWPRWSPNGEWIAYTTSDPEGGDGTLHIVRPDGSGDRELSTIPSQMYGLCWMPGSDRVIFASQQAGPSALWSVDLESGEQTAVTRGAGISDAPTISYDGRRLVFDFSHRRWFLYLSEIPGSELRRILTEPGLVAAALSPGGEQIALALGAAAQSPSVVVLDLRTMDRHTLSGMTASAVAWAPGGEDLLIAAAAPDGINRWIWRLPVNGSLPTPLMKGQQSWDAPTLSPDESRIAAVRRRQGNFELVVHDLDRNEDRVLALKESIIAPRWSPDGRLVAWSGSWRPDDLLSGGIWVAPAEGEQPRRLITDGAWPVWEPDGRHLLFLRFQEHKGIWRLPIDGGPAHLVGSLEGELGDLFLEGIDIGRGGAPLLLLLSTFAGEMYAFEPPES
jgi:DNA-binding winged helix-turn-helix (wHTH) protein/Tol biopolymer transport system component